MNKNLLSEILLKIIPRLLRKARGYVIYINMLLLLGGGIWLFSFVKEYFLDVTQDFVFMKEHASALYQVSLDTKMYAKISAKHEKKLHAAIELPEDFVSPF